MTNTMAMIVGSFAVCWLPIGFWYLFDGDMYRAAAFWMTFMNSLADPLIFIFRMRDIGSAIKKLFMCGCKAGD